MEHNTNHVIPWSVVGDLMFARRNDKHFISMDDTDGILFWLTERYNSSLAVERIIVNGPALVVFWKNGDKTVVKCHDEDFDIEKGIAMALAKRVWGSRNKMNKLIKTVFAFCSMLCLLNSTVNPIIYALRSKDLRHAFRSMFPSCEGTAQPLDNSMGDSDCLHKHANNAASVHRAAESCIKSTVKIAKVTMSVSTDTSAEAL